MRPVRTHARAPGSSGLPHLRVLFIQHLIPVVTFFLTPTAEALPMKPMPGLLALFVVATLVTVFAGSYGEGVVRVAGMWRRLH
jgi:VIT1/CCC1 family predicted Fe2+/Mn2+ transporter